MATATSTFTNPNMGITASFQAVYGGFVDANLQAFGWQYIAQTGDIDPNSVSAGSLGTYTGFRVYKTNDGLTDYYVRIDYGSRAYAGLGGFALKINVGTGVNGSGTLTGQVGTPQEIQTACQGGTYRSYISGNAGRFFLLLNAGAASTSLDNSWTVGYAIGRTVDNTGAPNSDGVEFYHQRSDTGSQNYYGHQYVPFSGTIPTPETSGWVCALPHSTMTIGASMLVGVPQSWDANGLKNPTQHVAIHDQTTLTPGNTVTLTLYGASHVYLVAGATQALNNTNYRPLYLYE